MSNDIKKYTNLIESEEAKYSIVKDFEERLDEINPNIIGMDWRDFNLLVSKFLKEKGILQSKTLDYDAIEKGLYILLDKGSNTDLISEYAQELTQYIADHNYKAE